MQLRFTDKEHFFHDLAAMLRSGIPLQRALEHLAAGRDRAAHAAQRILLSQDGGISATFAHVGFARADAEIFAAGEFSGRMVEACECLADYYARLAAGRRRIVAASAYPVFILHLGAVLLSIPAGVLQGDFKAFIWQVFSILSVAYLAVGACVLLLYATRWAVRSNVTANRMVVNVPVLGDFFLIASLSRFCLVISLGIRSADGVLASLSRAGRASESAWIQAAASQAVSDIRQGMGFAQALRCSHAFPVDLERGFEVAEASGRLDKEMNRWADIYRDRFFDRIESISVWMPRLLYLGILFLIASRIYVLMSQVFGSVSQVLEF